MDLVFVFVFGPLLLLIICKSLICDDDVCTMFSRPDASCLVVILSLSFDFCVWVYG